MSRISSTLEPCRDGRKALAVFLTAGYPEKHSTVLLAHSIAAAGADIIELGIPFSDPVADGPVIQAASARALANGVTAADVLIAAREIRKTSVIPLVLMGYLNPILAYGADRFVREAADSGVDGLIIADLPLEEGAGIRTSAAEAGLATILFVTPTTPEPRMREIDRASTGFVYGVSVAGVTGARSGLVLNAVPFIARARDAVRNNPLLVGFGISGPADAAAISRYCDGVIVGSALMQAIGPVGTDGGDATARLIASIRRALDDLVPAPRRARPTQAPQSPPAQVVA